MGYPFYSFLFVLKSRCDPEIEMLKTVIELPHKIYVYKLNIWKSREK